MAKSTSIKKIALSISIVALAFVLTVTSVFAWFGLWRDLAAYAPIDTPESIYIGAGHTDLNNLQFEDIRYLYFDTMDISTDEGKPEKDDDTTYYWDKVFCIYGKYVGHFRIQIAFTTNNQFTYELYHAAELTSEAYNDIAGTKPEAVEYTTHGASPETYYYILADYDYTEQDRNEALTANPSAPKLEGDYLNKAEEILANATGSYHDETYATYSSVQKYAEPLYWQSSSDPREVGNSTGNFANYYILRVRSKHPINNDRETDIICIAAKSA